MNTSPAMLNECGERPTAADSCYLCGLDLTNRAFERDGRIYCGHTCADDMPKHINALHRFMDSWHKLRRAK